MQNKDSDNQFLKEGWVLIRQLKDFLESKENPGSQGISDPPLFIAERRGDIKLEDIAQKERLKGYFKIKSSLISWEDGESI